MLARPWASVMSHRLESNCTDWDLSINGLSDDLRVKELLITFTSESDKERFKDAVGARRFATPLS